VSSIVGSATTLRERGSLFIKAGIVACVVGVVIAGSIALASVVDKDPAACKTGSEPTRSGTIDGGHGGGGHVRAYGHGDVPAGHVMVGPTCNLVEMVGPEDSTYRPDVAGASRADRARARSLLRGVNEFCRSNSASQLMAEWVPGEGNPTQPSHFFNPGRRQSLGLGPSDPRAVLIYRQQIGGVMFTGVPLPPLGSIPRTHTHDMSRPREMLHVYCTPNLAEAFTPNRELGVLADSIALRHRVRPLVAYLMDPQLTTVLGTVRGYVGEVLPRVDPRTITTPGLADPVLRAKREEIRQSLILLTEAELRKVLSLTRGR